MAEREQLTEGELRARFDAATANALGIEDEVMLLAPDSLELAPRAPEALALLGGDPRFKLELPACQLEIVVGPSATVAEAATALLEARRDLARSVAGSFRLCSAGAHPFSPGVGRLNTGERYDRILARYGVLARRQLVCALQVHVGIGDSDRALQVYNAARSYLPLLAALAANAPFYEGHDTGLASVRPLLAGLLPRQGVPPAIASWEAYAGALRRTDPQMWWWELRPHPRLGTLEFRVPDAQASVADAAAVAAVIQSLTAWLGERCAAGEQLGCEPAWSIEENRRSACCHGLKGEMVDGVGTRPRATRGWLEDLLGELASTAAQLGTASFLAHAASMLDAAPADRLRGAGGPYPATELLVRRFLEAPAG